uniref:Uncharacterized protein n=1 Tax=Anguilla anguilla TaxID=7936 RepID=A0A0E9PWA7_ANGAN
MQWKAENVEKGSIQADFVLLCTKKFLQPHCWVLDPTQRQRDNWETVEGFGLAKSVI